MPNHICNIVKVKGDSEEVKNFMESVAKEKAQYKNEATGYGTIDFNKVIPEPEYKNHTNQYYFYILYRFGKARGKKPRGVDGFFERIARRADLDEKRARRRVLVIAGVAHGDGAHQCGVILVQRFLHGAGEL